VSFQSHKKRVAVLRGGPSAEYDVSMQTGLGVLSALRELSYETKDVIVTKQGEWLFNGYIRTPENVLMDVDSVFIALHGAYGEDGTVRLCIPFTGSGSYASAIAMNKSLTKDFLKRNSTQIKMAPHIKLTREGTSNVAQVVHTIGDLFGPEYVIKPVGGGSSIGTRLAHKGMLYHAVMDALAENEEVLVEQKINGKEATVGILENFRGSRYYQLPAVEIVPPASAGFFSADVKYNGATEELCPGRFSKQEKEALSLLAEEVHTLLDLRQYSRSDFIVANDGIYFLEVNTLPGLTSESLFPKSMEAVGSSYRELVDHLMQTV
jgi:D-alanine-D-alanine ligase